jgi:hypothetical protein
LIREILSFGRHIIFASESGPTGRFFAGCKKSNTKNGDEKKGKGSCRAFHYSFYLRIICWNQNSKNKIKFGRSGMLHYFFLAGFILIF